MGGSVIGLFGDFFDEGGKAKVNVSKLELSGYGYLKDKNKKAFGISGNYGTGLWGKLKTGDVIRDEDFVGMYDFENLDRKTTGKQRDFLVSGFGMKVTNVKGGILNKSKGADGVTLKEIRDKAYARTENGGKVEYKVEVEVERVPVIDIKGKQGDDTLKAIDKGMCVVAAKTLKQDKNGIYDLFYLFSRIEVRTQGNNKFKAFNSRFVESGNSCDWVSHLYRTAEKTFHLHKIAVGENGESHLMMVGNEDGVYNLGKTNGRTSERTKVGVLAGVVWSQYNYAHGSDLKDKAECQKGSWKSEACVRLAEAEVKKAIHGRRVGAKGSEVESIYMNPGKDKKITKENFMIYKNTCNGKEVCIGLPWKRTVKYTQILN